MASLAQNFMKDLEELSDDEAPQKQPEAAPAVSPAVSAPAVTFKLDQIAKLLSSPDYKEHLQAIEKELEVQYSEKRLRSLSPNDPLYLLLANSNKFLLLTESEIPLIHKYVRDLYVVKFSELETLIPNPVDYAKVVQRIGNLDDLTQIKFTDLLPNNSIISITVAGSNTKGRKLTEQELKEVERGCQDILALDEGRAKILKYMERRMQLIAPNVCAIVGSSIGAKLVAAAGGIIELAKMPACNIQVLGAQRKALHGMSSAGAGLHRGFIAECELVRVAPEPLQINVIRMLSTKSALAARADLCGTAAQGQIGQKLRTEIMERFKKLQAPKAPKIKKPLPKPEDKPRRKRAGKRLTSFRRRTQMTEYRKFENRMAFGVEQQEYRDSGKTFGMLNAQGGGKLRFKPEKNQKILKKLEAKQGKQIGQSASGLASSLVFTQVQGIQLYNPDYIASQIKEQKDAYFNAKAGFTTVSNMKKGPSTAPATKKNPSNIIL